MKAKTRIKVIRKDTNRRVIPLDLSRRMKVTEVRVDGEPAEFFVRESLRSNLIRSAENDTFMVVLPKPMEAGE